MNEARQQNMVQAPAKNRLRRERELRGWSRGYVAEQIGSDAQAMGRWERSKTSPSPYYRQRLCELFHLNADALGLLKEDVKEAPEDETADQETPVLAVNQEVIQEKRPLVSMPLERPLERPWPLAPVTPSPSAQLVSSRGIMGIITFSVVIAMLCAFILLQFAFKAPPSFSLSPNVSANPTTVLVKPGGLWVYPANGQIVHGVLYFAAKAYPTHPGDPPINRVNFTIGWKGGGWRVGCTAYPPVIQNLFTCPVIMAQLNVPVGKIQVSFDVYDQMGNTDFAPNGVHAVLYAP